MGATSSANQRTPPQITSEENKIIPTLNGYTSDKLLEEFVVLRREIYNEWRQGQRTIIRAARDNYPARVDVTEIHPHAVETGILESLVVSTQTWLRFAISVSLCSNRRMCLIQRFCRSYYSLCTSTNRVNRRAVAATVIANNYKQWSKRRKAKLERLQRGFARERKQMILEWEAKRDDAALCIQSCFRGYLVRTRMKRNGLNHKTLPLAPVCTPRGRQGRVTVATGVSTRLPLFSPKFVRPRGGTPAHHTLPSRARVQLVYQEANSNVQVVSASILQRFWRRIASYKKRQIVLAQRADFQKQKENSEQINDCTLLVQAHCRALVSTLIYFRRISCLLILQAACRSKVAVIVSARQRRYACFKRERKLTSARLDHLRPEPLQTVQSRRQFGPHPKPHPGPWDSALPESVDSLDSIPQSGNTEPNPSIPCLFYSVLLPLSTISEPGQRNDSPSTSHPTPLPWKLGWEDGIIHLQCFCRATAATIYVINKFARLRMAAVHIQRAWRGSCARQAKNRAVVAREVRWHHKKRLEAALQIQCAIRGFLVRKHLSEALQKRMLTNDLLVQNESAIRIQANWRAHNTRRQTSLVKEQAADRWHFIRCSEAAVMLQSAFARYRSMKIARDSVIIKQKRVEKLRQAAYKNEAAWIIQSAWLNRKCKAIRQMLEFQRNANALNIERIELERHYKKSVEMVQLFVKASLSFKLKIARANLPPPTNQGPTHLDNHVDVEHLCIAAKRIQCNWRGKLGRQRTKQLRHSLHTSHSKEEQRELLNWQVESIQIACRVFLAACVTTCLRRHQAAGVVQRTWRRYFAVKRARANRSIRLAEAQHFQQADAATFLQAIARGRLTRKRTQLLRHTSKDDAVRTIQRRWRIYAANKRTLHLRLERSAATQVALREEAVTTVATAWRQHRARNRLSYLVRTRLAWQKREEENAAAVEIQRFWKGSKGRKHAKKQRQTKRNDLLCCVIQRALRAHAKFAEAQEKVRAMRQRKRQEMLRSAVGVLQQYLRAAVSLSLLWSFRRESSTKKLQRAFRCFHSRRRAEFLRRVRAATTVQRIWRGWRTRLQLKRNPPARPTSCSGPDSAEQELQQLLEEYHRRWRGMPHKTERSLAAVVIEQELEAILSREQERKAQYQRTEAAKTIQSAWRDSNWRAGRRIERRVAAALTIQRVWRGWCGRCKASLVRVIKFQARLVESETLQRISLLTREDKAFGLLLEMAVGIERLREQERLVCRMREWQDHLAAARDLQLIERCRAELEEQCRESDELRQPSDLPPAVAESPSSHVPRPPPRVCWSSPGFAYVRVAPSLALPESRSSSRSASLQSVTPTPPETPPPARSRPTVSEQVNPATAAEEELLQELTNRVEDIFAAQRRRICSMREQLHTPSDERHAGSTTPEQRMTLLARYGQGRVEPALRALRDDAPAIPHPPKEALKSRAPLRASAEAQASRGANDERDPTPNA
eukprot:TRINITY_DN12756_c0_g1_i1.p1 TRINITY_DN12756_c0_g1~~TRINITY_DN12756_c0_g1_i1.p1  ORF type:complete len:1458 (+),score=131.13 TRINITY_DN12756_c0_g1_i1:29-4402(+)